MKLSDALFLLTVALLLLGGATEQPAFAVAAVVCVFAGVLRLIYEVRNRWPV